MSSRTRILSALAIAVGMLILSYWVTNLNTIISGETALMRKVELVHGYFKPHINPMADSVLLINVAYDRQNVLAKDKMGLPAGYDYITDRQKLHELLKELKHKDDSLYREEHRHFYKYILLDVLFDNTTRTPQDSALFTLIASMKRIVIPRDTGTRLADTCLNDKAGLVNYYTNYKFVSFAKYPYLIDGKKSLPLKMYEEVTGHTITDHGFFANDGWRLARKSIVLPFVLRCDSAYTQDGMKVWHNMGMDLLGSAYSYNGDTTTGDRELHDNPELTQGKYIIIGAFSGGDMHYSYLENQPGPAILFNAYLSLLHGHHRVSLFVALLLLAAFFIMAWSILNGQTIDALLFDTITRRKTGKANAALTALLRVLAVVVSWVGYSMFLSLLCIFTYLVLGEVYDIFITATVFQLISIMVVRINRRKNKKRHA